MSAVWHWLTQGGPGGVPGDIVATYICGVLTGLVTILVWPRLRHLVERALGLSHLHAKLDHLILHSDAPNHVPGVPPEHQPKEPQP